MSTTALAYCAGLIDGEGHVKMTPRYDRSGGIRPVISVEMTCLKTLEHLQSVLGVGKISARKQHPGFKRLYRWQVSYRTAIDVAKLLSPLSITKRDELIEIAGHVATRGRPKKEPGC
jgi:hypothetical protein